MNIKEISIALFKNASTYGIGLVLLKTGGLLLLPIYLMYLSPSDYGVLSIVLIASSIIAPFLNLGLPDGIGRYYYAYNIQSRQSYVGSVWIFYVVFSSCLIIIIDSVGATLFPLIITQVQYDPYIRFAIWTAFFSEFSSIPFMILRVSERLKIYLFLSIFAFILTSALNLYFIIVLGLGIKGMLLGSLLASIIMALFWISFMLIYEVRLPFNVSYLKSISKYSLPSIPSAILESVGSIFDRYFLDKFLPLHMNGIYSLGKQFGSYLLEANKLLKTAWIPFIYKESEKNIKNLRKVLPDLSIIYFGVIIIMGMVIIFFGPEVIYISKAQKFYSAIDYIPAFVLSFMILCFGTAFGRGMDIAKKTMLSPIIPLISTIISYFANFILVQKFGLSGAIVALLITVISFTFLHCLIAHYIFPRRFPLYQISLLFLVALLCYLISLFYLMQQQEDIILRLIFKTILILLLSWSIIKIVIPEKPVVKV